MSPALSELAGAGTAASEIRAEERGHAGDRGEPAAPRPDAAGRWGPQYGSREERGCAAVVWLLPSQAWGWQTLPWALWPARGGKEP